jgi:hypothetical protein
MQFGTFRNGQAWTNIVAIQPASGGEGTAINGANNCQAIAIPVPGAITSGSNTTFTCVPAAISVQILNGNALQTTSGIQYGAVCPTQLDARNTTRTWTQLGTEVIAYMRPRLVSAAKLALRGVQMNSYPLDMTNLSDFTALNVQSTGTTTWDSTTGFESAGWAPMVVYNPDKSLLTYLVCVEWRVRFDMANPAVASHTQHSVTPDPVWNDMIHAAVALGHGVRDIATEVANAGVAEGSYLAHDLVNPAE